MQPRLKNLALRIDDASDARIDGDAVQLFEPRHTHALEVAFQRAREETSGLIDGKRRADVGACDRAQREGQIGA
jgi:hypothetical protein